MKNLFFIVGLPRSRTAWLANFLTNGDAFCHHELMRTCSSLDELKAKLEATEAAIVGDADPGLVNWLPEAIEKFPEAKFVFISRKDTDALKSYEAAFPSLGQNKIDWTGWDEIRMRLMRELETGRGLHRFYEELEEPGACNIIHDFCLGRPMDRERWKLLNGLRVTGIAEKARPTLAPWAKLQLVRQSDPQTKASLLWENVAREICGDNKPAFQWLCDLKLIALTWDHIVDQDRVNILEADLCFEAMLLKWPMNPFWALHQKFLAPVLANAVSSWRHGSRAHHFECYTHPALAVAYLIGGPEHQARFAERIHELARMATEENDQREVGQISPESKEWLKNLERGRLKMPNGLFKHLRSEEELRRATETPLRPKE